MSILRKMADFFAYRLTPRDPRGWPGASTSVSDAGTTVSEGSALALSAFWACRALIAGTISTCAVDTYRTRNGQREEARDHPLWRVLHDSPNYDQTAVDFWDFVVSSIEFWGDAFGRVLRERGEVIGIIPINPQLMTVRRLSSGALEYRWVDAGKTHVHTDADMLHIRGPGGDPLGGLSTMAYGRQTFGLARAANLAASGMFANGLRPSGTLQFKEWLTVEQRSLAEGRLGEKYTGAINAGRPLILEGGVEWKPITINPEEAQMLESRSFSVEEICRYFGVPPHMVGHTDKSTSWGTGLEQQVIGFLKFTLRARMRRIEQAVMKQLLTPDDRAAGVAVEFNIEALLRGDSAGRAEFYNSGLDHGWMTINEVRRMENLPPVAGGDVPRMQMQNVPLTQAGKQPEAIAP